MNIKHLSERKFLILAVLWTIGIAIGSLVRLNELPKIPIAGKDKIIHFLFYFILFVLWSFALNRKDKVKKINFFILIFVVIFGIIIEALQGSLTHYRQADFNDVIANFCGALLGLVFINWFPFKFFKKK